MRALLNRARCGPRVRAPAAPSRSWAGCELSISRHAAGAGCIGRGAPHRRSGAGKAWHRLAVPARRRCRNARLILNHCVSILGGNLLSLAAARSIPACGSVSSTVAAPTARRRGMAEPEVDPQQPQQPQKKKKVCECASCAAGGCTAARLMRAGEGAEDGSGVVPPDCGHAIRCAPPACCSNDTVQAQRWPPSCRARRAPPTPPSTRASVPAFAGVTLHRTLLPTQPPFVAHLGNLKFDLKEQDVIDFFVSHGGAAARRRSRSLRAGVAAPDVKFSLNAEQRPSGHANATFATVADLKAALELNEEVRARLCCAWLTRRSRCWTAACASSCSSRAQVAAAPGETPSTSPTVCDAACTARLTDSSAERGRPFRQLALRQRTGGCPRRAARLQRPQPAWRP